MNVLTRHSLRTRLKILSFTSQDDVEIYVFIFILFHKSAKNFVEKNGFGVIVLIKNILTFHIKHIEKKTNDKRVAVFKYVTLNRYQNSESAI